MKLYGDHTIIVTDATTGQVVFAGVYDAWWQRDRAVIESVGPKYKDKRLGDRYRIQIGMLSAHLPSLAGHPLENIARLAEQYHTPIQLLLHAQHIEERRINHVGERLKFFTVRYGYLVAAILLMFAASGLLHEARRQSLFANALNEFGALALVAALGSVWCLWRHAGDWTYVATIGSLMFLAAVFADGLIGPFLTAAIDPWMQSR